MNRRGEGGAGQGRPRVEAAPDRRPFPEDGKLDLKKRPTGLLIYLRPSNPQRETALPGKSWPLGLTWPGRLVRGEVDLDRDMIRFFTLRRKGPASQPQISEPESGKAA